MDKDSLNLFSEHRRFSNQKGYGVQYLPGHIDPFVDLVVNKIEAISSAKLLDLGGGGLRFAYPASRLSCVKFIEIVDLDKDSLDIDLIGKERSISSEHIICMKNKISVKLINALNFQPYILENKTFDVISSFRFLHFFDEETIISFLKNASDCINSQGLLVISGISKVDLLTGEDISLYKSSLPVNDSPLYREIKDDDVLISQNLSHYLFFFEPTYLISLCKSLGFILEDGPCYSTKIVQGYIFRKK